MKKTLWISGLMILFAFTAALQAQEAPPTTSPDTRVYIIRQGDTLWDISGEVYQDPQKWPSSGS